MEEVKIELSLEALAPPVGRARLQTTSCHPETDLSRPPWMPFVGWLGLLRTLSDLIAAAQPSPPRPEAHN